MKKRRWQHPIHTKVKTKNNNSSKTLAPQSNCNGEDEETKVPGVILRSSAFPRGSSKTMFAFSEGWTITVPCVWFGKKSTPTTLPSEIQTTSKSKCVFLFQKVTISFSSKINNMPSYPSSFWTFWSPWARSSALSAIFTTRFFSSTLIENLSSTKELIFSLSLI